MEFITVAVPASVLLTGCLKKKIQTPGDIVFTTVKLYLEFQIRVYCPIELGPFTVGFLHPCCGWC